MIKGADLIDTIIEYVCLEEDVLAQVDEGYDALACETKSKAIGVLERLVEMTKEYMRERRVRHVAWKPPEEEA